MRFNRAKLEVPVVESRVVTTVVVQGLLLDSPFYMLGSKLKLIMMEQFIAKTDKYILLATRKDNRKKKEQVEGSRQGDYRTYDLNRSNDFKDWGYKKKRGSYHQYPMSKNFPKVVHTIVGGPPDSNYSTQSLSALSSSRSKVN